MKMLDLFSGIGGFSLAAQWVWGNELEIVAFVEIDDFCKKVLAKNFPGVPIYDDIKKIQWVVADSESGSEQVWRANGSSHEAGRRFTGKHAVLFRSIDLLTGGWPCPPVSCAGKRRGTADDRWLWPEVVRAVREIRPRYCLFENVPGLLTIEDGMVFEGVCADLEGEGYEVVPLVIPAAGVGAPHRRDRVWIVAYAKDNGSRGESGEVRKKDGRQNYELHFGFDDADRHAPDTKRINYSKFSFIGSDLEHKESQGEPRGSDWGKNWESSWHEVATRFCRVDDGVADRVDRLKCLGNSIVPQVAYQIMMAIKEND